ncbi:unnamed protein product [Durusdinium trenchii]|uniref:C3H1-type domain-containing protein n=1 Tax=Durusdinium trenchii TaxID=1381693 RepID=A0ABP0NGC2_9DINO
MQGTGPGDHHAHIIWATPSEGSSSQSVATTSDYFRQMPFIAAQPNSSSSSSSQDLVLWQQQQQQQQLYQQQQQLVDRRYDFRLNFGSPGGPCPSQMGMALQSGYPALSADAQVGNAAPSMAPTSQTACQAAPISSAANDTSPASAKEQQQGQWSKGSAGHDRGACRPCHYFHSRTGCANGDQCLFCHLKHAKRSRMRIPKHYRQQCRALAQLVFDTQGCEEEIRREMELQLLIQTSFDHRLTAYATSVLKSLRGGAVLQDFPQGLANMVGDEASDCC